jgi:hypothetical protein
MSFKTNLKITAVILGISAFIASCTLRQTPPGGQPLNVNESALSCMDNMSGTINSYLKGTASDADVNALWDCTHSALDTFTQRVRGQVPGQYSSDELRGFLERYYIHKINLTDAFMQSCGIIKTLIVGGRPDQVSLGEIAKLQAAFETLRSVTLSLRPYMPISTTGIQGKVWKDVSETDMNALTVAFDAAALQVGTIFDQIGNSYTFDQFIALLDSIEGSLPVGTEPGVISNVEAIRSRIPLVQAVKAILLSPLKANISTGSDWKVIWTNTARWASLAIKTAWLMDPDRNNDPAMVNPLFPTETLIQGKNLTLIDNIFGELVQLLNASIARRPSTGEVITFVELNDLIDQFKDSDLPINKAAIESLFPLLVNKMIAGVDFGTDGRAATGVTPGVLLHFTNEFNDWYEGQRVLQELFSRLGNKDNTLDDLLNSTTAVTFWQEVQTGAAPWNSVSSSAASRLLFMLKDPKILPMFYLNTPYEISFPLDVKRQAFSFHDVSNKNWMQAASIMMIQGYVQYDPGEDKSEPPKRSIWRTSPGVNFGEFATFFNDLTPFGIAIKMFDPDDKTSGSNRFRELDTFTNSSNGDGSMSVLEAVTYLGFDFSDLHKSDRIHNDIASRCPSVPGGDKYGQALIEPICYRKAFFGDADEYLAPIVTGASFLDGLQGVDKAQYEYLLEVAARKIGYNEKAWMTSDDTEGFVGIIQYIESMFARYDLNRDGTIDWKESDAAFPVVKHALQQFAATSGTNLSDGLADVVFTFMLDKGKVPDTMCHPAQTDFELAAWIAERALPFLGHYKANRLRLAQIFGAIGSSSSSTATGCGAAPSASPVPTPDPSTVVPPVSSPSPVATSG